MSTYLLDAIAARVIVGRKRLPCAVLRDLLLDGKPPLCSRASVDRSLLLAAVAHALLVAVLADWRDRAPALGSKRWDTKWQARPRLIAAWRFQFASPPASATLRLPRATYGWLSVLEPALVHELVRWAPPIVSPVPDEGSPVPVLGNVPTAFLARQVLPDDKVWVRVLEQAAPPKLSLPQLATAAVPLLTPIVARYRDRIVQTAPTADVAEQVTGLQRAMVFRIRQPKGAAYG